MRPSWIVKRRNNRDSPPCDCSNGACQQGPWRTASRDIEAFLNAVMCAKIALPNHMLLAEVDRNTKQETSNLTAKSMHPKECHNGECEDCGIEVTFANLPETIVFDRDGNKLGSIHACTREATDDRMKWFEFRRTPVGTSKDGTPTYANMWQPVCGPRKLFFWKLYQSFRKYVRHLCCKEYPFVVLSLLSRCCFGLMRCDRYASHIWKVRWTQLNRQIAKRLLLEQPAMKGEVSNMIHVHHDFAAALSVTRKETKTCQFPESVNMFVACFSFLPERIKIAEVCARGIQKPTNRNVWCLTIAILGWSLCAGAATSPQRGKQTKKPRACETSCRHVFLLQGQTQCSLPANRSDDRAPGLEDRANMRKVWRGWDRSLSKRQTLAR